MALLEVQALSVDFGGAPAVDGLSLRVEPGEVLGIVGESGSGKSLAMLALMGLVDPPGRVTSELLRFDGQDLRALAPAARRRLAGPGIAMVFQDAGASLDPAWPIGFQLRETLRQHGPLRGAALNQRAAELLARVEIADPWQRLSAYPHQLSGGMAQRVMIALAIAHAPRLLIADEPSTALDVTIQAQIMELLLRLAAEQGMAMILISHDLALVAQAARRVLVMYAGQAVEAAPVPRLFEAPRHPYTRALLDAMPEANRGAARLRALPGIVPGLADRPPGCLLAPRCPRAQARCAAQRPAWDEAQGLRCFFPLAAEHG